MFSMKTRIRLTTVLLLVALTFLGVMLDRGMRDDSLQTANTVLALNLLNADTAQALQNEMREGQTSPTFADATQSGLLSLGNVTFAHELLASETLAASLLNETEDENILFTEAYASQIIPLSYTQEVEVALAEERLDLLQSTSLLSGAQEVESQTTDNEEASQIEITAEVTAESTASGLLSQLFATKDESITEYLNVRDNPDGNVVGKLYPGSGGTILAQDGEWTQISSGNLNGWVKTEFIATGMELLSRGIGFYTVATTTPLNVRDNPDGEVVASIAEAGQAFGTVDFAAGWVCIQYSDTLQGYVSADYVTLRPALSTGITLEEEAEQIRLAEEAAAQEAEAARIAAEQAEAARIAAEEAARAQALDAQATQNIQASIAKGTATQSPTYLSYNDIYLMACVVTLEAGGQPYEGQIAVANVILNRLRSGYWGGSVTSVIYAPGQFYGANTGYLASYIAAGPSSQALQAVYDACAGINTIGNYLYFCSLKVANYSSYSSYTVLSGHCFYNK